MARALLLDRDSPVAQIARRLDVSRATFYAYFPQARTRSLIQRSPKPALPE